MSGGRGAAPRLAWGLMLLTAVVLVTNVTLAITVGGLGAEPLAVGVGIVLATAYPLVGAVVASRQPRNPVGWLMIGLGLGMMLAIFAEEYATLGSRLGDPPLPAASAVAWVGRWIWIAAIVQFPLLLLVFPSGSLPSPRWRPVPWLLLVGASLGIVGTALDPAPITFEDVEVRFANPLGVATLARALAVVRSVAGAVIIAAALACGVAVVMRFRRARGEERQQMRWLAYVSAALVVLFLVAFVSGAGGGEGSPVNDAAFLLLALMLGVGVPAAVGIAVLRYRLYQLDVVVKKTVVAAVLVAAISVVYVLVVVAIPVLVVGVEPGASGIAPLVATVIAALAIQPIRQRARRWADRLVYGRRASPYEVLSEFAERVGETYSVDDVLPRMAQLITAGTGATRAEVWLRVGDRLRREAAWPAEGDERAPVPLGSGDVPAIPDATRTIPVRHQGELLGALALSVPASDPLTPSQERLLQELASQAGLVLRNVALTASLRARLEELRASRERLVKAQDEERRKIERNLHDGAQQRLVALAVRMRLAGQMVDRDPAKAKELIDQLQADTQAALDDLRDLARGIYPPLLADQGLPSALEAQARRAAVPVRVVPDGIGRYPREVESAVYFCVLEALQNAAKYAEPSQVTVRLEHAAGDLVFRVTDDGRGFDATTTTYGTGLQGMADRLAALGGRLEVRSEPGRGTTVEGSLPTGG